MYCENGFLQYERTGPSNLMALQGHYLCHALIWLVICKLCINL